MNRIETLLRWLPCVAAGAASTLAFAAPTAFAQTREMAATLLPARPAPAPLVVRGATPDANLPSFTNEFVASVPATGPKSTWAGAKIGVLRESVFGKPNAPDAKSSPPDSRMVAPATSPIFGTGASAQLQPLVPPPGVYASPPAYRWYGWGGTTPGANPHAPAGVYPQGSANWYSHTGATPGAFPVTPMASPTEAPAVEAPAYAGRVSDDPSFEVPIPTRSPDAKPRYLSEPPIPEPRIVARTPIGSPAPEMPAMPSVPRGAPVAIATEPSAPPPPTELNWQTASGKNALAKEPIPVLHAPPAVPLAADPAWSPVQSAPATPAVPTVSVIRGQSESREPQSIEAIIRSACIGRVAKAEVRSNGDRKLVVTFVAASEYAAREAAALVAKLPELKSYDVAFEARIVPR